LWQAQTTTGADRRAVVRQLIERVVVTRRGDGEEVEVVVRWRGGAESRHEVQQGLQRYNQLSDYEELRARVTTLRGEGQSGEQIASLLNQEGYRTPRGGSFTGHRVRRMFMLFGLTGIPAGVCGSEGLPGRHEWWLPELAAELGVKPIVLHRWRWSGWVHARQLPGDNGRWIVWADGDERRRLRRLREHEIQNKGRQASEELRQPKARPEGKTQKSQPDNARTE
jgi:hypothetical protein